jgi:hypothetical protein
MPHVQPTALRRPGGASPVGEADELTSPAGLIQRRQAANSRVARFRLLLATVLEEGLHVGVVAGAHSIIVTCSVSL